MTSPQAAKGAAFERGVVDYLRRFGFPQAARTLAGAREDRGDVSGVPAILQLKNHKRFDISGWLDDAAEQAANAGLPRYAVVAKRPRHADVADSYAIVPLWLLAELLRADTPTLPFDSLPTTVDTAAL